MLAQISWRPWHDSALHEHDAVIKQDAHHGQQVGLALFPPQEAAMIADVVERDLPYYDPVIFEEAVAGMSRFARAVGLMQGSVSYEQVVATRFRDLWIN